MSLVINLRFVVSSCQLINHHQANIINVAVLAPTLHCEGSVLITLSHLTCLVLGSHCSHLKPMPTKHR
ncbi:30S ribosomal protein S4, chloroplastic, partial [Clarias magur]